MTADNTRLPVVAGKFYPADASALRAEVEGYLKQPEAKEPALACMLPHAGYIFSGAAAGLTLGRVQVPERVFLLGPNHTGRGPEFSLWPGGAWRTPLGDVPVDAEGAKRLLEKDILFQADRAAHLREHSLEVLLPFLQVCREDCRIIPLCVRSYDVCKLERAGLLLAEWVREAQKTGETPLLLASSDMSHHLPHDEGQKLDRLALEQMEKLDPEGLFRVCVGKKISMCGAAPVTVMLYACRALGAANCRITVHTSSGITGRIYGAGMDSVVGYAGAVISEKAF